MTILQERLHQLEKDVLDMAEVIGTLESERNYYKQMCARLVKIVDRQDLSYAETVTLDSIESMPVG